MANYPKIISVTPSYLDHCYIFGYFTILNKSGKILILSKYQ